MQGRDCFTFLAKAAAAAALIVIAGCASAPTERYGAGPGGAPHYKIGKPYRINGKLYRPAADPDYNEVGVASWYGDDFHGRATANGEIFDMRAMTAAHTTLPMPSLVEVTNLENGRRAMVRVNDRGPFAHNRIIDLSRAAARALGFEQKGLAKVRVRYVGLAPLPGAEQGPLYAQATPKPVPSLPSTKPRGTPVIVAEAIPAPAADPVPAERAFAEPASVRPIAKIDPPARDAPAIQATDDALASLIAGADPGGAPQLPTTQDVGEGMSASAYLLQVAVLSDLEEVPVLRARLAEEGPIRIARLEDVADAAPRYRINLGPFYSETSAAARLEAVREAGYIGAEIIAVAPQ